MIKEQQIAGSIYQRNGRWWWRVKVPGQNKFSVFPLKAPGAKYAYIEYRKVWCNKGKVEAKAGEENL